MKHDGGAAGTGTFGIVYTAFDMANSRKVAIKEYFTTQFVNRILGGTTVIPITNTPDNKAFTVKQKRRFYQEAEKMQLFHESPNVADVLDISRQMTLPVSSWNLLTVKLSGRFFATKK